MLIPTKRQFQKLTKTCDSDQLAPSLNIIFGNETESRIRAFIKGYAETLRQVFEIHVYPFPAYEWLRPQPGFEHAQHKAFPVEKAGWMDKEVSQVMKMMENILKSKTVSGNDRKTILRLLMNQVQQRMQRKLYWLGHLSKCLCAYHYPKTSDLGKIREKSIEAGVKVDEALRALHEITAFSEYMPWLPLPDNALFYKLNVFSNLLNSENIKDLTPIKRADSSFMERLFVIQLADGHARYHNVMMGCPLSLRIYFTCKASVDLLMNAPFVESVSNSKNGGKKRINYRSKYTRMRICKSAKRTVNSQ